MSRTVDDIPHDGTIIEMPSDFFLVQEFKSSIGMVGMTPKDETEKRERTPAMTVTLTLQDIHGTSGDITVVFNARDIPILVAEWFAGYVQFFEMAEGQLRRGAGDGAVFDGFGFNFDEGDGTGGDSADSERN